MFSTLKNIFKIIPDSFSKKLVWHFFLTTLNLILDLFSVFLILPIIIGIFNPNFIKSNHSFNILDLVGDYTFEFILILILFFLLKNILSIKIIEHQSNYYYAISNVLAVSLLEQFLNKSILQIRKEKHSSLIKNILIIPNNFVIYVFSAWIQIVSNSVLLVLIFIGLLIINPIASFVLLAVSIVLIGWIYFFERRKLKIIDSQTEAQYNATTSTILNAVNGYAEIKINQLEPYFLKQFNTSNTLLFDIYSKLNSNRLSKSKYTETGLIIVLSFVFIVSKYMVNSEGNTILFFSFLFASVIKIVPSLNRILINVTNFKSNLHTVDLLLELKNIEQELKTENVLKFNEKIEINAVCFSYNLSNNTLLDNINLTIHRGEIVGLFGESGSGKSTLVNIISTLLMPQSGQIAFDSKPVTNYNKDAFLKYIGYVSQRPFVLEGTVLENMVLNNKSVPDKVLNFYINAFDLKSTIDNLPNGVHTFIGNNGFALSGGQLQRIVIIRTLLREPKLLILDEALNQLDVTSKNKIIQFLIEKAQKDKLSIVSISHNITELQFFCDTVYELKNSTLKKVE